MARSPEYVLPLAVVCLEKTNGNPFYLRQMLELCHRKGCLWYSWKEAAWKYDLDRVFAEFTSAEYGQQLNTDFVTKRLQDLPPAARSILAWASLLGNSFSFGLVQKILEGEFLYSDNHDTNGCSNSPEIPRPRPVENLVEGLQAALQAYILMPGGNEDEYSFSHSRYVKASNSLRECHSVDRMHFVISQTMMKYPNLDGRSSYARAQHVCQAAGVIAAKVQIRKPYRRLLSEVADKAIESGARPTALQYYKTSLGLLQSDPWRSVAPDVDFEETLSLYMKAAELYWHQGQSEDAQNLLNDILAHAQTAAQKAPAWIIQSKLLSDRGDTKSAFAALKTSLLELGLEFAAEPTWEICDKEYAKVKEHFLALDQGDVSKRRLSNNPQSSSMGAVMIEAISAAFWSDSLLVFNPLFSHLFS